MPRASRLAAGASRRDVQDGIERVTRVPGRMERVEGKGIVALVDYAHTDDALVRAMESARGITKGKLMSSSAAAVIETRASAR